MSREAHVQFCESLGVRFPGATHLVILSRGKAEQALNWTRRVMTKLKLTLNEAKTSIKQARKERFNFLGYAFWAALLSEGWPLVSSVASHLILYSDAPSRE